MDAVSPMSVARTIAAPVLLVHGEDDQDTPPDHARRVFAALTGPKRLLLVPGAGRIQSLQGDTWREVEQWIDANLAGLAGEAPPGRLGDAEPSEEVQEIGNGTE